LSDGFLPIIPLTFTRHPSNGPVNPRRSPHRRVSGRLRSYHKEQQMACIYSGQDSHGIKKKTPPTRKITLSMPPRYLGRSKVTPRNSGRMARIWHQTPHASRRPRDRLPLPIRGFDCTKEPTSTLCPSTPFDTRARCPPSVSCERLDTMGTNCLCTDGPGGWIGESWESVGGIGAGPLGKGAGRFRCRLSGTLGWVVMGERSWDWRRCGGGLLGCLQCSLEVSRQGGNVGSALLSRWSM
jgi:hypothetical protein